MLVKTNAVTQAKADLDAATMTAPFAGIVAEVSIAEGDSTSGSQSTGGSQGSPEATSSSSSTTAAIVLISKDSYTVSTSVSSSDVASVTKGLQAELSVTGATDTLYGTVSSVAVAASSSSSGTASFPVVIDVTGTHEGLFAGSSVTVEIVTSQLTNVIAVPATAITTTDGVSTVTKVVDGVETPTEITVGETIDSTVVVTDGLADGDQIVITTPVRTGGGGTSEGDADSQFPGGAAPDGGEMPGGSGQMPGGGQMGGEPPSGEGPNR